MRIFETYAELQRDMKSPDGFRFLPRFGPAGFVCSECGAVKAFALGGFTAGYGLACIGVAAFRFVCLECCHRGDLQRMRERPTRFCAYLSLDGKRVTGWLGFELARVIPGTLGESRSGWHGSTIARFHARDAFGQWWQGRGAGRGIVCTLRPMKAPAYARQWLTRGADWQFYRY